MILGNSYAHKLHGGIVFHSVTSCSYNHVVGLYNHTACSYNHIVLGYITSLYTVLGSMSWANHELDSNKVNKPSLSWVKQTKLELNQPSLKIFQIFSNTTGDQLYSFTGTYPYSFYLLIADSQIKLVFMSDYDSYSNFYHDTIEYADNYAYQSGMVDSRSTYLGYNISYLIILPDIYLTSIWTGQLIFCCSLWCNKASTNIR